LAFLDDGKITEIVGGGKMALLGLIGELARIN
jgi:hypothetical protein